MDDCRQCVRCGSKCVEDYCPPCAGRRIAELEAAIARVRAKLKYMDATEDGMAGLCAGYVREALTPTTEGSDG